MAWVLSDPTSTSWVSFTTADDKPIADGPRFRIGFWPPGKAAQIEATLDHHRVLGLEKKAAAEVEGRAKGLDGDALDRFVAGVMARQTPELAQDDHDAWQEIVRWAVRDWEGIVGEDGQSVQCQTRKVVLAGQEHVELLPESLWLLKANRLLKAVGVKAALFNQLTAEEKKRSAGCPNHDR